MEEEQKCDDPSVQLFRGDNATEKYDCPTCGETETKFVGHPDTECFDCYVNRSGMPT